MAVRIRLMRCGTKHKPHYKIVVTSQQKSRNSNFIEELGFYNPTFNPPLVKVNRERTRYWLESGAKPTETVERIFKREKILLG